MIKRISFIGSGNVATSLALAFKKADLEIVEVYSPNQQNANQFAKKVGCRSVKEANLLNRASDLFLVAVPDDKVKEASEQIPFVNGIVAHTSGNCTLQTLSGKNKRGVFYPLQSFSGRMEHDMREVPICVEGEDNELVTMLKNLAEKISKTVVEIDSEQRKYLHLTAVMVNNFTNHLYQIADEILYKQKIDFQLLKPLILETASKIQALSPADAQTGPAKRNDVKTIQENIRLLNDYPEYQKLYQLISDQITKKYYE